MMERYGLSLIFAALTLSVTTTGNAQNLPDADRKIEVSTTVGIEGSYPLRHRGEPLEARPVTGDSPILLRIASRRPEEGGATMYELRFIAIQPGIYDLRDLLRYGVDRPARDVAPIWVRVLTLLPPDHDGGLSPIDDPLLSIPGTPTLWMILFGVVWLVPIAIWIVRRRATEEPEAVDVVSGPTLADQLRPLVETALAGTISRDDKARLEMLLLTHWRDSLELGTFHHGEAIARMRKHPEAGELLNTVERWLHAPTRDPIPRDRIHALLETYRTVAAVKVETSSVASAPEEES
jgi:hypothetical protein